MKKLTLIASALCAIATAASAQSGILAGWDFANLDTFGPGASWENTPANHGVLSGLANIKTSAFEQLDSVGGTNIDTFQVTTNDGTTVGTAGTSFSTAIDDPAALAIFNQGVNGKAVVVEFRTLGASGISFQYAVRRGTTAATANQWAWSIDGVNFTNFGAVDNPTTSYAQKNYDLTGVTDINNKATVFLRYTLTGSTATGANPESALAIDNFRINAVQVPEPAFYASLAGILALGFIIYRRRA